MYLGDIVEKNNSDKLFKNPLHPYTKALLAAIPTKKGKRLENIKGQISPITQIVTGCKFHPRCNCEMELCKNQKPIFKNNVSCHLYNC